MTYEEFATKLAALSGEYALQDHPSYEGRYKVKWWDMSGYGATRKRLERQAERDETPEDKKDGLYIQWVSGGQSGGSCWSEAHHYAKESEPEPEWDDLENLLDDLCPNIGRRDYKAIFDLVETGDFTQGEYYGNYTEYRWKWLSLRKLYDHLVACGAISGEDE